MNSDPSVLTLFSTAIGADRVRPAGPSDAASTGAAPRKIAGTVFPESVEEVRAVVNVARSHRVPLYPVSRGLNWGLGSKVPPRDGCLVVSLERMNKIRRIDLEFGCAEVEAGVTQGQLAEELKRLDARFTIDVTGVSGGASLVGNTLERGIAYHTQRSHTVRAFEVVLGNGDVFRTGFGREELRALDDVYDFGIGPDARGLFFQSNFGIVTSMTISLLPRLPTASLSLNFDAHELPEVVTRMRGLLRDGVITGIPHIANEERFRSSVEPALLRRGGADMPGFQRLLRRAFPQEWNMLAVLSGPKGLLKSRITEARAVLRGVGKLHVLTDKSFSWLRSGVRLVSKRMDVLLGVLGELRGLARGIPSEVPSEFLNYRSAAPGGEEKNIDAHPLGFYYLLPVAPLDGDHARRLMEATLAAGRARGFSPGITFNLLNDRVLEGVISVVFEKSNAAQTALAGDFCDHLLAEFPKIGAAPYRTHIDHYAKAFRPSTEAEAFWRKIKDALDPDRILSPGRYLPF